MNRLVVRLCKGRGALSNDCKEERLAYSKCFCLRGCCSMHSRVLFCLIGYLTYGVGGQNSSKGVGLVGVGGVEVGLKSPHLRNSAYGWRVYIVHQSHNE